MSANLPLFHESYECRCRAHCVTCRDPAKRSWREQLGRWSQLPPGGPDFECPHGKPWGEASGAATELAVGGSVPVTVERWHELWEELHTKEGADAEFVLDFTSRVPCGSCKAHWVEMLGRTPPVFGAGWFRWTWERHDEVNVLLGKERVPLEAAAEMWGMSTPV